MSVTADTSEDWSRFIAAKRTEELDRIVADEGLKPEETRAFIENPFRDGAILTTGTAITKILPPASLFSAQNSYAAKKHAVLDKLAALFDRYFGLAD